MTLIFLLLLSVLCIALFGIVRESERTQSRYWHNSIDRRRPLHVYLQEDQSQQFTTARKQHRHTISPDELHP